ncbi:MAG: hypothetical protein NC416_04655 [Eubacterium sp.]|nr:hypothetical protein [Eubacterium sp.]
MLGNIVLVAGIALWGYVLTGILRVKRRFGPVLAVAVSMAVLEIGGAFGVLWPVAKVYCVLVCVFSVVYMAAVRDKAGMSAYFSDAVIIGFLFAGFFYLFLSRGEALFYGYRDYDTFLHWGMFFKTVFYEHNLDIWNPDLYVNHQVYPHGMAAWYALFVMGKKTYRERDVMLCINVLLFASSCPVVAIAISRIRKILPHKKIILHMLPLLSGICVAGFLWIWRFEGEIWPYRSSYMDIPLGVAFMAALCLAVTDGEVYYGKAFAVSLVSAMLVMIKPTGMIFVVVVVLAAYLLNEFFGGEWQRNPQAVWKFLRGGVLCISIPLLELAIWNVVIWHLNLAGGDQFSLKSFLPGQVILKYQTDPAYAKLFHEVIRNFAVVFFSRGIALHISAFFWMLICIALAVISVVLLKDRREKRKVLYVNAGMLLLFCFYNLFLLWTYLTTMSKGEALGINCYDRYIGTYFIGWFGLSLYFLFFYQTGSLKVQSLYFSCFFLCCIFGFFNKNTFRKEINSEIWESYEMSGNIRACILKQGYDRPRELSNLWISCAERAEAPDDYRMIQLKYYLFPDFDVVNVYGVQKNYQREIRDIIAEFDFDYLVLYGVNDDFYDAYYWFFSDGLSNAKERYEDGQYQAYKVIRDEATNEFCWFEPIVEEE